MTPEADRDSTPHHSFPYHAGWRAMACGAFFFGVLGGVAARPCSPSDANRTGPGGYR